jgi:hypothetical protein
MFFAARRAPVSLAFLVLVSLALEGCGKGGLSREEEFTKNNPRSAEQQPVAKFAGRVSVDGMPQVGTDQLFVFLADPQHPEKPKKYYARCNPDGSFEFTTYLQGDGVTLGKYVVGVVALRAGQKSASAGPAGGPVPYRGPDGLKNLYNDPDKNKDVKEFVVDVTQPGRTDYEFNLSVAGKDPGTPGAHSLKYIGDAGSDF